MSINTTIERLIVAQNDYLDRVEARQLSVSSTISMLTELSSCGSESFQQLSDNGVATVVYKRTLSSSTSANHTANNTAGGKLEAARVK